MVKPHHEPIDDSLVAMTEAAAARLAHVSVRRLRYWTEQGVVGPTVARQLSERNTVRLYGFQELLEVVVAAELRTRLSLQQIRRIIGYLRDCGYEHPLAEVRFALEGDEVYIQHADGTWEGARRPGQYVFSHVLALEPLRERIRATVGQRPRELNGRIERRRKVLGSKAVFAGTRTPVSALFPYLERGYTTKKILEAFPHLSGSDVKRARAELRKSGAA